MHFLKKSLLGVFVILLAMSGFNAAETSAAEKTTKITILHTNDSHGRVFEGKYDGMGFSKLATLAKQKQAENPNTLLLDAGDTFHGTPFATLEKGESIVEIMNHLDYDGMAAGNHDFNYGQDRLLELADLSEFPVISANVRYQDSNNQLLPTHFIQEVDGVKIGVFGLTTPETTYKTNPKNIEGLAFTDIVEEGKAMVKELQSQNVDLVIALTHLGTDASSTETSIKLAENVDGIDLIVDGHSHTVDNINKNGGETLIVSAGEYTKNLGIVELEFDSSKKLISKEASRVTKEEASDIVKDSETESVINKIKKEQDQIMSEVVGKSNVILNGERNYVRTGETNLGNLITNAMLAESDADVAITNGGGIRASIDTGEITLGEIINVSPFGNYLVTKKMSGKTIKEALEHGVSDYPATKGAFPHVAGMSFSIDPKAEAGQRVKDLMIQGEDVQLDKVYTVATNDFLAAGGDDYGMFVDTELVNEYDALEEIMKSYIKANTPIELGDENRVNIALPFTDVDRSDWGYDHIEDLYGKGIFNGVSETMFGPHHTLTRVQLAALLVRTLELEATQEAPFSDLGKASESMQKEISAAYENGLVFGYEDNTFRPHQAVKRFEMALMIQRAYEKAMDTTIGGTNNLPFEDLDGVSRDALDAIQDVYFLGFMTGHDETTFEPYGDATRQQSAKVMDLFLQSVE
ncbi:5'-nucleotidase C-terminal domain-containing protein [Halobacillus yeomjeoni]|uniref:5'-nucleotidase C-terminal domain-containing protein n=1 Tax=Halobacillus yeomjeoni TaxID=311194 RepID=UPI001CD4A622|nr:5'-nucleotidase C-terminal domain-containing protein [Halobacillus yeomjeoni]MCA0985523.1 5'-nucleotidase C-terminal domain-containing protein [Halobacillus yeomjeoni]